MPAILLADDSALTRELLQAQLQGLSPVILEASDGLLALDLSRMEHPRVAVLDWDMPGLNGVEVCAQLKADPATQETRVVIVTANTQDDVQGYVFGAGADDCFAKPWDMQTLRQRIAELLAS
jgi:CheY-like chemotaxis protein